MISPRGSLLSRCFPLLSLCHQGVISLPLLVGLERVDRHVQVVVAPLEVERGHAVVGALGGHHPPPQFRLALFSLWIGRRRQRRAVVV